MKPYIIQCARLISCDESWSSHINPLGVMVNASIVVDPPYVLDLGNSVEIQNKYPNIPIRWTHQGLVTPGLIDAHTHAAWARSRHEEYIQKQQGVSYEEIASRGGGICNSMDAIKQCTVSELEEIIYRRLLRMAKQGVTTVEIKSGYGLTLEEEIKQLCAIKNVSQRINIPKIISTYLGLHAVPPVFLGDKNRYASEVTKEYLPEIAKAQLADFVDVYIDRSAFSVEQSKPFLVKAQNLGFKIKMHIGQFADVGGAFLAAEVKAHSVDHVENIDPFGIDSLAKANVLVGMLPVASYLLKQKKPPVTEFRKAGLKMYVASDANPGTSQTESLPLAMAFALREYEMSPEEILLGVTKNAARSLDSNRFSGSIQPKAHADIVLWNHEHENELFSFWGTSFVHLSLRDGMILYDEEKA